MKYKVNNQLKYIYIFFWNLLTKLNYFFFFKKKNYKYNLNVSNLKKIKVLIIKPYYYTDLYSQGLKSEIKTIESSRYRMGPIGLILNFDTEIVISNFKNDKKLNFDDIYLGYHIKDYCNAQYEMAIDFNTFDFDKYDWVLSIKDSVPLYIVKQYPNVLWTKLYEDHRENGYSVENYLGSVKYDLTLDTTQGFTPYNFLKNDQSISFPYSFSNSDSSKQMNFQNIKEKQLVTEIYQPKNLSFETIEHLKVFNRKGNLKTFDYLNLLSNSKYFYCPIYELPRWGNSIIEAATFNCLIIGNPNCFWNSLLIQKECIATSHTQGLEILKKFQNDNLLYKNVLEKQRTVFNLINYEYPLSNIFKIIKKKFPNKKISNLIKFQNDREINNNSS
jgi:hypothetical protein